MRDTTPLMMARANSGVPPPQAGVRHVGAHAESKCRSRADTHRNSAVGERSAKRPAAEMAGNRCGHTPPGATRLYPASRGDSHNRAQKNSVMQRYGNGGNGAPPTAHPGEYQSSSAAPASDG